MSITRLPREQGMVVRCNGCPAKYYTGNISATNTRAWIAKHDGWGRGSRAGTKLILGTKRHDLCPPLFSSRQGAPREGLGGESSAQGAARREPQSEDGTGPEGEEAAQEEARARRAIDGLGKLTLGGFTPRTGYVVIPGIPALWWKPCITRAPDSTREHCWFPCPDDLRLLVLLDVQGGARPVTPIVMAMSAHDLCARCGTYTEHGWICELCAPRSADVRARHSDEHRAQDASAISRIQQRQVDIGGAYAQWSSLMSVIDSGVEPADGFQHNRSRVHRPSSDVTVSRRVRAMSYRASEGVSNLGAKMKVPGPAPLPFNHYTGPRSARR